MKTLEEAVVEYVENVQEATNKYFAERLQNLVPDLIRIEGGRKYVKISRSCDGGRGQTCAR